MMTSALRFDGQVAIVTGAGAGIGRSHAMSLAARGAKVIVNDVKNAEAVVDEIASAGGTAFADGSDVSRSDGTQALVEAAINSFGRLDILIANAGILRDRTLTKMSEAEFEDVLRVHLNGTAWCIKASLEHMGANNYGRILVTTSAAGLYGNFGQANYAAAKLGIVGLMKTVALEERRHGVLINAIAPAALTSMTANLALGDMFSQASAEEVAMTALYLVSQACQETGAIVSVAGRYVSIVKIIESSGQVFEEAVTPELIRDNWSRITAMEDFSAPSSASEALQRAFEAQRSASA